MNRILQSSLMSRSTTSLLINNTFKSASSFRYNYLSNAYSTSSSSSSSHLYKLNNTSFSSSSSSLLTSTSSSLNNNNNHIILCRYYTTQQQQHPILPSHTNEYEIQITDRCETELNKIGNELKKDVKLRVMVDTGGCSGFQYIIKLDDNLQEDDIIFNKGKANVIIDKISLDMMKGSVIDYESELMRSSFCVAHNPNTIKSCGCKISFDLKK